MEANVAWDRGMPLHMPRMYLRSLSDERLARMVAAGNDAAFTMLFERFRGPVYRYCRSLVGNDTDAQDALQATFTQALVALRDARRSAPVRPWLYRIAHNEVVSLLRRRRPTHELPADEVGRSAPSAHELMERRTRLATLVTDLQALPERQRGALVMRELAGQSHAEIAETFGISVGAAKQTVLEARRSLQQCAGGRAMACLEVQRIVSEGDGRALRGRGVRAHLRDCEVCDSFAAAIKTRRADLRALSPALPGVAASGLLARITGAGSGHGGGSAGAALGTTGKAAGMALSAKAVATGAAVVIAAVVGTGAVHRLTTPVAGSGSAPTSGPSGSRGAAVPVRHASGSSAVTTRGVRPALALAVVSGSRHSHRRSPGARATPAARMTAPAVTSTAHRAEHAPSSIPPTQVRDTPSAGGAPDHHPAAPAHRSSHAEQHRPPAAESHARSAPGSRRAPVAASHHPPRAVENRPSTTRAHRSPAPQADHSPAASSHHPRASGSSGANRVQATAPRRSRPSPTTGSPKTGTRVPSSSAASPARGSESATSGAPPAHAR